MAMVSPGMQSTSSFKTIRRLTKDESQLLSLAMNTSEESLYSLKPERSLRKQFDAELKLEFS